MIPKILHQVWLGDNPIPDQFNEFTKRWKNLHPDWDYILWDESKLKKTDCWKILKRCDALSSKSNIARIYAIANFGGVYSDFDIEWISNIDHLLSHKCFAARESEKYYCNAFFGSIKNSPWITYQYHSMHEYVNLYPPWGPKLITKASLLFPEDLFTIDSKLVYPFSWNEDKTNSLCTKDCYVIHHWSRSWSKK